MVDVSEIERRVDRAITATIPVTRSLGGIDPKDYGQVMEFAKTMATCRAGIPQWLRASPGDCLMICSRAMRWGMDPYFVAEKSYLMQNNRTGETRVGYESQLIHAVVESLAPLKGRLRHRYEGEGDDLVCIVYGTFIGEDKPHEYISVTLGKRIKDIGRSDKGNFRGSPNWLQKPRLQLFYDASRDWARENCPDVLAGVYTRDELPDMEPVDVTPTEKSSAYAQRLRDTRASRASGGFDADRVMRTIVEGEVNSDDAKKEVKDEAAKGSDAGPVTQGERVDGDEGAIRDRDADRRETVGGGDPGDGPQPAGHDAEGEQSEGGRLAAAQAPKPKGKRR